MRNVFFSSMQQSVLQSRKSSILLYIYIYLYMNIFIIQYNDAAFHFFNQHRSVISCNLPVRQYGGCFQKQYLYMCLKTSPNPLVMQHSLLKKCNFSRPNLYVRSLFQLLGLGPVFQGIFSLQAAFVSIHSFFVCF